MQTVLIDTDIAIDFLRGVQHAKELIIPLWKKGAGYLSLLSVYELHAGMKPHEKEATEYFIQACHIEPITLSIAEQAGDSYQRYRKQGITLTAIDCLIYATALVNKHQLATRNLRHYPDKHMIMQS